MDSEEIIVAFAAGDSGALGNFWRITAKKTDFYLDPVGQADAFHLTVHGPSDQHPEGTASTSKADRRAAEIAEEQGTLVVYKHIPRRGKSFGGEELAPGAFRVARIRWLWDLQRLQFREAAFSGPAPDISGANQSGARLSRLLAPNEAADIDLVVSYNQPYWPNGEGSLRDNARLGPLSNKAGMWLTVTCYQRWQVKSPAPKGLVPPLPKRGEEPNRIMGGGLGPDERGEMYWFVEAITSRQLIEASRAYLRS